VTGRCEQCLQAPAEVYALDPMPGGWGGRYCRRCAERLSVQVVDRLSYETLLRVELRKALDRRRQGDE
jgi:hypothetical protein